MRQVPTRLCLAALLAAMPPLAQHAWATQSMLGDDTSPAPPHHKHHHKPTDDASAADHTPSAPNTHAHHHDVAPPPSPAPPPHHHRGHHAEPPVAAPPPPPPEPPHHHHGHTAEPPVVAPPPPSHHHHAHPAPVHVVATPPSAPAAPPPAPKAAPPPIDPNKGTATGLPLPRFAALRSDQVNMRAGPGMRYPITWTYQRRDLPVQIEREFEVWRLVSEPDGTKGWVHQATLTGRRSFLITGDQPQTMRAEANDTAAPVAILKPGVVGRLLNCAGGSEWCQVSVKSYSGYLNRSAFWGTLPAEAVGQ